MFKSNLRHMRKFFLSSGFLLCFLATSPQAIHHDITTVIKPGASYISTTDRITVPDNFFEKNEKALFLSEQKPQAQFAGQ